jgi:uncharacterized protein (TIGR04255 family)
MARIPRKLKIDPIVEALWEVRFASNDIPEVVVGKLASREEWKSFKSQRLPVADIPTALREADPELSMQPTLQLQRGDDRRLVKIGPRVISYHALRPYPGWQTFEPELVECARFFFGALTGFTATRLGFRYINILTKDHLIENVGGLNFNISLDGNPLECPLNLNYQRGCGDHFVAIVRVASREFVLNPAPDLVALADVDIFTPDGFKTSECDAAQEWLGRAHELLKEEFFTLLPERIIDQLEEKT